MSIKKIKSKTVLLYIFIVAAIVFFPVMNSFLGIDLVDTGYYYYQYEAPFSDYGVYTSFLANIIGGFWLKIFGNLGLWGLNLLEIFLEWIQCFVVYQTFKTTFGKRNTLIGCALSMLLISTYVNVFNYHQLNMFFCTVMLCFMYVGLRKEKKYFFILSGSAGMLAVFSRMPSILGLLCVACIIYWGAFIKRRGKHTLQYSGLYFLGYLIMAGLILAFLKVLDLIINLNISERVLNEVFRLRNLGKSGGAAYGSSSMISNFITDNLHAIWAAFLFLVCVFLVLVITQWKCNTYSKIRKLIWCVISLGILPAIGVIMYEVGGAPAFIQLTSFNWFLYGMCFLISIVYILSGIFLRKADVGWSGLILLMSMALILLCCVGSAARLKHVVLGMWFILPFVISQCEKLCKKEKNIIQIGKRKLKITRKALKQTYIYTGTVCLAGLFVFLAITNNFDSVNRLELTSSINSDKVRFLKTTEREAKSVNEVLKVLKEKKEEDKPLMVLGNAVMLYSLAEMESYVKPWVSGTSYTVDDFTYHIDSEINWKNKKLPIIVWSRTNPYEGFSEEKYEELVKIENNNDYSGKRQVTEQFMDDYEYKQIFENDYFVIYDTDVEEW